MNTMKATKTNEPPVTAMPGPWFVKAAPSKDDPTVQIWAAYSAEEQREHPQSTGKWIADVRTFQSRKQRDATAKLIAAAPDLLAALRWLVDETTNGIGENTVVAVGAAKRAIAKCEGR